MRSPRPAAPLVLLAAFLAAPASRAQEPLDLPRETIGRLDEEIEESSGIDRQGEVFWTHSDSGNPPVLFAIDRRGTVRRRVDLSGRGIENVDWEDLAVDGDLVYVGDIGDNRRARDVLSIHRVEERPDGPAVSTIRYSYPDARHDAEALFVREGRPWVVSKAREGYTNVYRIPPAEGAEAVRAELVGRLEVPGLVTAADYDPGTRILVASTYTAIHFFRDAGGDHPFAGAPAHSIRILAGQMEAICWDGPDVLFTNEGRDVFRIERPLERKVRSFGPKLPRAIVPRRPAGPASLGLRDDATREPRDDASLEVAWDDEGLRLAGRFPVETATPLDLDAPAIGSSLHLLLGTDLSRPQAFRPDREVHLLVAFDAKGRARLVRLDRDPGSKRPLVDLTERATVEGALDGGLATFRAGIPWPLVGLESPAPGDRLLFNCFALETGDANRLHWSAELTEFTHEKPYSWGEWELGG